MNLEYKMTTTGSLNSIAANTIFDHVLKTDPTQEAPGAHEKFSFGMGYKMFEERAITIMFK